MEQENTELRRVMRGVIEEFLTAERSRAEPAHKAELAEERRRRESLERRVNELVEENQRARRNAEESERSGRIRSELQRLGVGKVELAFQVVKGEIARTEDGRLVAKTGQGEMEMKDYLAAWVQENPEFLPARIAGGSGSAPGPRLGGAGGYGIELERIRPGMSAEELQRVRERISRWQERACGASKSREKKERKMAAITSANLANAIVKLVAVDALPALMGHLVMGNLVNRDFEPALAQAGDTVNVPIPPVMQANNIAEGGTVVTQNPNLQTAQIVLNSHVEATFQIPDVTKVIAVPDLLRLYMQPAMVALAERVESDLLGLYSQFTANAPLGTGGTAVTETVIDAAETALFNAKVPASEPKYMVVSGAAYSQLRQVPRFSEYNSAGEAGLRALVDGSIGKLKDFYVFRSHFVPRTGTTPVTTHNVAFAKSAIGLAIRRLPKPLPGTGGIAEYAELGNFGMRVVMSYQPNTLAQQFTVDMLYGVGVLRNSHGVQVRS